VDKTTAKGELRSVEERLAVIDLERDALLKWRDGLVSWLALQAPSGNGTVVQPRLPLGEGRSMPSGKPVGSLSLRRAVLDIVREAGGRELTTDDILQRARTRGADSAAKDPANVVDLILYTRRKRDHAPLERTRARTWRWVGQ
jgi:hypothetical protein